MLQQDGAFWISRRLVKPVATLGLKRGLSEIIRSAKEGGKVEEFEVKTSIVGAFPVQMNGDITHVNSVEIEANSDSTAPAV